MPRPRRDTRQEWDMRITPADQSDWLRDEAFDEFVRSLGDPDARILVFQEGGPGVVSPKTQKEVQRHYHGYLQTNASHSHIYTCLSKLTNGKGSDYYRCIPAHEGTQGYVSKQRFPRCVKNFTEEEIESIYEKSAEYRRVKETNRKRKQRAASRTLTEIVEQVRNAPTYTMDVNYVNAFRHIAAEYDKEGKNLPSRSVLECAIVNLIGGEHREYYYLQNFKSRVYI